MSAQPWTENDIPGQKGRVVIITGANSGIGLVQARALAAKSATVVLACRSQLRSEAARAEIIKELPQADVRVMAIDTADLASVRRFAEAVRQTFSRLDLLINNAGVMAIPQQLSVDGFELQMATNHFGHFALTGLLLPLLEATAGSRIVVVSSLAARRGRIHFDDLTLGANYKPWSAYEQTKLANLIFAQELHRRLQRAGSRIVAVAAHPGISRTNLFASPGDLWRKQLGGKLFGWMLQPADRGALPILYAATAEGVSSGDYYGPGSLFESRGWPAPARIAAAAQDEHAARRLWEISERSTGVGYL